MKFLVDSFGNIGFDTNPIHGPFKESVFWFSEDLNTIYSVDNTVYKDNGRCWMVVGLDRVSTLHRIFDDKRDQLVLAQSNGELELDYFCEDFTKIILPSLHDTLVPTLVQFMRTVK